MSDSFRDSLTTLNEQGERMWIFAKKPTGYYHNLRALVAIVCLTIFFVMPFIKVNGHPLVLINVLERKFILFGTAFWPQDFNILLLAMLSFFVFIILFTAVFGRAWCGWTCPQTVFMEMVFRKIEYWIEGDYSQQQKLAAQDWDVEKIYKKTFKQILFIVVSLVISHTVMAYIIGVDGIWKLISGSPLNDLSGFFGLMFFTALFYVVFAHMREIVCTVICPYGRLQGVLMNKDTIQVSYDYIRGEPRAKKKAEGLHGDCIDCNLCVKVCPTGIDIRNGSQLECVNCTACIDVCDEVMLKVNQPKGLIRFASLNDIEQNVKFKINKRIVGYTLVLALLLGFFITLLVTRSEIETTVLRVPGMIYEEQANGDISNMYNLQMVNKTFHDLPIRIKVKDFPQASLRMMGGQKILQVSKNSLLDGVFIVDIPKQYLKGITTKIVLEIYSGKDKVEEVKTKFLAPAY
jgi:cytochrome c oxidase accessory protein FixG